MIGGRRIFQHIPGQGGPDATIFLDSARERDAMVYESLGFGCVDTVVVDEGRAEAKAEASL